MFDSKIEVFTNFLVLTIVFGASLGQVTNNISQSNENSGNFVPSSLASITNSGLTPTPPQTTILSPKFATAKSDAQNIIITDPPTKQGKTIAGFMGSDRDTIQTSSSHVYPAAHHSDGGYSPSSFGGVTSGLHGEYQPGSTGLYESTGFASDNLHHVTYSTIVASPSGHEYDGLKAYKTPVADYHFHEHHIKGDHLGGGHDGYGHHHGGEFYGHDEHFGGHHDVGHYGGHHGDHHGGHHAGFHESFLFGKALALKTLLIPLAGVALLGAAAAFVTNPVLLQLGVVTGKKKRRRRSIPPTALFSITRPHKFTVENVYPVNENVKPDRKYRHV